MSYPFTNLVFEGTGVRNCAYAGALKALAEAGIYQQVERVAGTSSGAIVATLVSVGYSPPEVCRAMFDLDFARLRDGGVLLGPYRLLTRHGWHPGEHFVRRMEAVLAEKTDDGRITFGGLTKRGYRPLSIVATSLTARTVRVFSAEATPDVAVADAVRCSMSIPFFFCSRALGEEVFTDGGLMWNFPIDLYDEGSANPATLGLYVDARAGESPRRVGGLRGFAEACFAALLSSQELDLEVDADDRRRSIGIDDLGIPTTHFDITPQQKQALMDEGERATRAFLRALGSAGAP